MQKEKVMNEQFQWKMVLILVFGIKAIFHIKLDYVDRWVGKQNIRLKLLMVPPLASTSKNRWIIW